MERVLYKETFRSPFPRDTREEALKDLASIREQHPESSGWIEISAGIELVSATGKYYAYRKHKKVS